MNRQSDAREGETFADCLVIIPAFNEGAHIERVVGGIAKVLPQALCLVVDDGSRDETVALARKAGARVISHPFNLGYGVALQTGYKFAARRNAQVIVQIDGDGQHDPAFLPEMVRCVRSQEVDVVIGSRFHAASEYRCPISRRFGIRLFNAIVRGVTGQRVTDSTSGYQVLSPKVLPYYTSDLYPWDYPDADVLLMLHYANLRYREVPVRMYPSAGKSMHQGLWRPAYYVVRMFLAILVTVLRGRRIVEGVKT